MAACGGTASSLRGLYIDQIGNRSVHFYLSQNPPNVEGYLPASFAMLVAIDKIEAIRWATSLTRSRKCLTRPGSRSDSVYSTHPLDCQDSGLRRTANLRFEWFHILNRTQFGTPNITMRDLANFGWVRTQGNFAL